MNPSRNFSHPLLWSFVLIAFVVLVAFFFRYWYQVGAEVGINHPRPTGGSGGIEVPDHAAMIAAMDTSSIDMGRAVYEGNCISCHGADGLMGANGARLFSQEEFKNGADPYSQYLTLARGLNLMPAQTMLSPEEKYAVIHYVREVFLREQNPSQYVEINAEYLAAGTWPAPGAGDGPVDMPYGKNATAPLTVPVMAVSKQFAALPANDNLRTWSQVVTESNLSILEQQQWQAESRLSPYAAGQLLQALRSDDSASFVIAVGDYLPQMALLPKDRLLAMRESLRSAIQPVDAAPNNESSEANTSNAN